MQTKTLHLVGMTHRNYMRASNVGQLSQSDMLVMKDDDGHPWTMEFTYDDYAGDQSEAVVNIKQESTNFDFVPVMKGLECEIKYRPEYGGWTIGRQTDDGLEDNNPIFSYSEYGNGVDFKTGGYKINAAFRELKGHMNHPVWIFVGAAGSGKSTIAHETGRNAYIMSDIDEAPASLVAYDIIIIDDGSEETVNAAISRLSAGITPIIVRFDKRKELE